MKVILKGAFTFTIGILLVTFFSSLLDLGDVKLRYLIQIAIAIIYLATIIQVTFDKKS